METYTENKVTLQNFEDIHSYIILDGTWRYAKFTIMNGKRYMRFQQLRDLLKEMPVTNVEKYGAFKLILDVSDDVRSRRWAFIQQSTNTFYEVIIVSMMNYIELYIRPFVSEIMNDTLSVFGKMESFIQSDERTLKTWIHLDGWERWQKPKDEDEKICQLMWCGLVKSDVRCFLNSRKKSHRGRECIAFSLFHREHSKQRYTLYLISRGDGSFIFNAKKI